MNKWYNVKVKYTKQLDNGAIKRVTEAYLIAAMTFTEAEARIYTELGQIIRGEFEVSNITPLEIHDIFAFDDCGEYYRAKVQYETVDIDTETPKKVMQIFLIEAEDIATAADRLSDSLKTLLVDYKVSSFNESRIVDIFPYKEP